MVRGEKREEDEASTLVTMARYSGHGLTLALAIGFFLFLGWSVDQRLGTTPLLTVIGSFVGAGAGFYHLLQHIVLIPRAEEEARRAQAETRDEGDPTAGPPTRGEDE